MRRLGLTQVRWSPAKSDLGFQDSSTAATAAAISPDPADLPNQPTPADLAREAHKRALAAQRDALALCQQQYGEAAAAFRQVVEAVSTRPSHAREQAQALTSAMLDKMLVEGDLNLRLLNEAAGDRAPPTRSTSASLPCCWAAPSVWGATR